ncbi:DENN domain-containing protein 4C [Copidosoma floridanum]|uniref:DENN domain-containing protein 4C n=1 Tax=Copidosoma floridanum TaxID=29053 RepID=UPI000C6F8763|nr:DENN domain-containing protein 4C [Copidosoma floridanum]
MDERRIADYFVVAGLPIGDEENDEVVNFNEENEVNDEKLEKRYNEGTHLEDADVQVPITDLVIIFPGQGETCPEGFTLLEHTVTGFKADLNHGSLRSEECYLCFRRGRDKPPLVDIGVMYDGKERLKEGAEIVEYTPGGLVADVSNTISKTFVTYRRASKKMPCNSLVVTDICVILVNKGETPPHAFCVIPKNLNKGLLGSDVYLCYKKSMNRANLISFRPEILYKYPKSNYANFSFPDPDNVAMFCLPMGCTIECWPKIAEKPKPVVSTFVLTVAEATRRIYGTAITFYEEIVIPDGIWENEEESFDAAEQSNSKPNAKTEPFKKFGILKKLNQAQLDKLQYNDPSSQSLNISKSICILSHWPFFDTFERFLNFLHSLVNGEPQGVPIEKYISYFLCDIPFPSPQRPRILVQLSSHDRLILTQPEDLALPRSGASFRQLLLNLGADNCLLILLLTLTEQKILVHSLRPDVLTSVSEAIAMILFPLKWELTYIPFCPLSQANIIHAPMSFFIGMDSRFFDICDLPTDVNYINLDTNTIAVCNELCHLNIKLLPKKPCRVLKNALEKIYLKLLRMNTEYQRRKMARNFDDRHFSVDEEFQQKRREQGLELEIQDAFLRFMAMILKGYRSYLLPITKAPTNDTTDIKKLFKKDDFLRSQDKTHAKFYSMFVNTQMFARFIEKRSFDFDMDMYGLVFFDDCIERCDKENGMLLEFDESQHSERTVVIPSPEPRLNQPPMIYDNFKLDSKLMKSNSRLNRSSVNAFDVALNNSPMTCRTKHEIKVAQRMARTQAALPERWGRCLLNTCFSLWFLHLPAMLQVSTQPANVLHQAYELLVKMQKLRLNPIEEVCYRAMMQLCGVYKQPLLAVKLLFHMKRSGVQPNALTYGFYNKAVLEAKWPSNMTNSSQLMWNKLRNVIISVALFRKAGKKTGRHQPSVGKASSANDDFEVQNMVHTISKLNPENTHTPDTKVARSDSSNNTSIPDFSTLKMKEKEKKISRQNSAVIDPTDTCDSLLEALDCTSNNDRFVRIKGSRVKSLARTPVTKDDPLGALANNDAFKTSPCKENNLEYSTCRILNDIVEMSRPGGPLLYCSNSAPQSLTSHEAVDKYDDISVSVDLHMKTDSVQEVEQVRERIGFELGSIWMQKRDSVTSSLSSIGSSLKDSFNSSGLNGKTSNELILGGLNSLKSTVARKFDEIKGVISTTSTLANIQDYNFRPINGVSNESLDSLADDSEQDQNELSASMAGAANVDLSSLYKLADCLYPKVTRKTKKRYAVELVLSSASRCHNCSAILYDEEIMAGWQPEDSNLNTICQFCDKATVPLLTVTILDYRCENGEASHDPLMAGLLQEPRELPEPISVPYLNPLVLRKELESVLSQEGDACLTKQTFIQEHPIVYWNLIWYYERINLTSHLPELWLGDCEPRGEPLTTTCATVGVRTLWDNEKLHMDRLPMYIQWRNNIEDRAFMQNVITYVRRNDLVEPIRRVALERNKSRGNEQTSFSIYRDILFLAFIVLGRGNIDQGIFDREYTLSLDKLTEGEESLLCSIDAAPSLMTLYCRHFFKQLNV